MGFKAMIVSVALASTAVLASPAQADPTQRQLDLAQRYVSAMRMERTFEATMDAMSPGLLPPDENLPPEKREAILAAIRQVTGEMVASLSREMAPMLVEVYTQKELEDVVAFYESPSGRAMIDKAPQLSARMAPLLRDLAPRMRTELRERLCKISACPPEVAEPKTD